MRKILNSLVLIGVFSVLWLACNHSLQPIAPDPTLPPVVVDMSHAQEAWSANTGDRPEWRRDTR